MHLIFFRNTKPLDEMRLGILKNRRLLLFYLSKEEGGRGDLRPDVLSGRFLTRGTWMSPESVLSLHPLFCLLHHLPHRIGTKVIDSVCL